MLHAAETGSFSNEILEIDDYVLSNKNGFRSKNYKQSSLLGEFFTVYEGEFARHQVSLLFYFLGGFSLVIF